MKKILLVATEFAPGMIPFASTIINTLSKDDRFDVQSICVNSGSKSYVPYIEDKEKVTFVEYPSTKFMKAIYKIWPVRIISEIRKQVKTFKPDVIHFLTGDFSLANYIRFTGVNNMCYTVHDLHPHEVQSINWFSPIKKKFIDGNCLFCIDRIKNLTTSSKSQIRELEELYPNKNVSYTPFPTLMNNEIEAGGTDVSELVGISNYILFFGAAYEYKGIDLLIEAYSKIDISDKPKLVIAGRGGAYETPDPNVIRINRFIKDSEVRSLFENARLIVYPYISATMSGVLSIAYYFKKKVLLSDVPFFVDNKTSCCTYFKAGDLIDLLDKLKLCLLDVKTVEEDCYSSIYSEKALADAYYSFYSKMTHE